MKERGFFFLNSDFKTPKLFHIQNYIIVSLTCRVYNVAAMSFTPEMIYHEVKKHVPNLAIEYNIDDRQKIGKFSSSFFAFCSQDIQLSGSHMIDNIPLCIFFSFFFFLFFDLRPINHVSR